MFPYIFQNLIYSSEYITIHSHFKISKLTNIYVYVDISKISTKKITLIIDRNNKIKLQLSRINHYIFKPKLHKNSLGINQNNLLTKIHVV